LQINYFCRVLTISAQVYKVKRLLTIGFVLLQSFTAFAQGADAPVLAFNGGQGETEESQLQTDTMTMVLEGTYQGTNLYINNPANVYDSEYAIIQASLNGKVLTDINKSNFMVDFSGMRIGKYVRIELIYRTKGYPSPQILNPTAIRASSSYQLIGKVQVNEEFISWNTKYENSEEPFIIERDLGTGLWSDWILVGTVIGKGSRDYNEYRFIADHLSGDNKYRIKQRDGMYQYKYMPPVSYTSSKAPVTLAENAVSSKLKLSSKVAYEIYDGYGRLIAKGNGKVIDISAIQTGTYFIRIENKTQSFVKR